MDQQQESCWRPTRRHLLWAVGIAALAAFLIIVICGYLLEWKWTGVPKRTFWNWLDLLIVPIVLAVGGYLFTRSENRTSRVIEMARRQEDIVQAYVDKMLELVSDKQLLQQAHWSNDVMSTARVRTSSALRRLDKAYMRGVLEFLHSAQLINRNERLVDVGLDGTDIGFQARIVGLSGVDVRGADLRYITLTEAALAGAILEKVNLSDAWLDGIDLGGTYLSGADLRGANLRGASLVNAHLQRKDELGLRGADLTGADLSGANLHGARITKEQLEDCRSLEGAIMPDGGKPEDWLKN